MQLISASEKWREFSNFGRTPIPWCKLVVVNVCVDRHGNVNTVNTKRK